MAAHERVPRRLGGVLLRVALITCRVAQAALETGAFEEDFANIPPSSGGVGVMDIYFRPHPQPNPTVREGAPITLFCGISNSKDMVVGWSLASPQHPADMGEMIVNDSRRYQNGTNLEIRRVDRHRDLGHFKCVATNISINSGGRVISNPSQLNIQWLSDVTTQVQSRTASLLYLSCTVAGSPTPDITWVYNFNQKLYPSDPYVTLESYAGVANRLLLLALGPAGQTAPDGVYACKASNPAAESVLGRPSRETYTLVQEELSDDFTNSTTNFNSTELSVVDPAGDLANFNTTVLGVVGKDITLNCPTSSATAPANWFLPNETPVTEGGRLAIVDLYSLSIPNVVSSDAGVYRCQVSKGQKVSEFALKLNIAYIDDISELNIEPKPEAGILVFAEGAPLGITCLSPEGVPSPSLSWSGALSSDSAELRVSHAETRHGGLVTCRAENRAGRKEVAVTVVITVLPVITSHPAMVSISEGGRATFSCSWVGNTQRENLVTVEWLAATVPGKFVLTAGGEYQISQTATDKKTTSRLVIPTVAWRHKGEYSCRITAKFQQSVVSQSAQLVVKKRLKFSPPLEKLYFLKLHAPGEIVCRTEGEGWPIAKWCRQLSDGTCGTLPDGLVETSRSTGMALVTQRAARGHAGVYMCKATTGDESIRMETRVTIVREPSWQHRPSNISAAEGSSAMLHCLATGDPPPRIYWLRRDGDTTTNVTISERIRVLTNNSLALSPLHLADAGVYSCVAASIAGTIEATAVLSIGDPAQAEEAGLGLAETIIIVVVASLLYLGLIVFCTVYCSVKLLGRKKRENDVFSYTNSQGKPESTELLERVEDSRSQTSSAMSWSSGGLRRADLRFLGKIGAGVYGEVHLARIPNNKIVSVKSLMSQDEVSVAAFRRDSQLLRHCRGEHIVQHIQLTTRPDEAPCLVAEYCEGGDLCHYLRTRRSDQRAAALTDSLKIDLSLQVVRGVSQVHNLRQTHGDLATRNVLLTSRLQLKLTALGLSVDGVYAGDYQRLGDRVVSVRWDSREAVVAGALTPAADIWSLGVLLWEIWSGGEVPHARVSDDQLLTDHEHDANRPPDLLADCPDEVTSVMERCWQYDPRDRPSAAELLVVLTQCASHYTPLLPVPSYHNSKGSASPLLTHYA